MTDITVRKRHTNDSITGSSVRKTDVMVDNGIKKKGGSDDSVTDGSIRHRFFDGSMTS